MKCGPARVEGPPSQGQTPWPWRTDRARGPAAHGAKRHLLNTVETSFEPSLNQPMKCGPARVEGPPSQGPNTMALEDGSGPRASSPRCQTSPSEHRRNQLRTFPKPAHEVRPGAGRGTPLAGPKHHGPGGRIGPAGQQSHGAKRHLLNTVETSFERFLVRCSEGDVWHRGHVLQCVWALRGGSLDPLLPGRTSWAGLGKVRSWFLRCSEGDVWHRGLLARGPDPSSRAMVFGPCEGGPSTRGAGPHFMGWFRNQLRTFPKPAP